jgi:hypothetical protein
MNERIKELAEQAGAEFHADTIIVNAKDADDFVKKFAELVRQDLYQEIGKSVITQIQAARKMEREACAKLCDEIHKNWHQTGVRECAAAIRGRKK